MISTKTLLLVFILVVGHLKCRTAQTLQNDILNQRIKEIFGTPIGAKNPLPQDSNAGNPESCKCVHYTQCNGTHINMDGVGVIDIRSGNGECDSYLEVCCSPENVVNSRIRPIKVTDHSRCGLRNTNGVGFRIMGSSDNEVNFGEFPWMMAVLRLEEDADKIMQVYHCGGSLIHPRVVLTAAHCIANNERKYVVRAGEWDTQTTEEILAYQSRSVKIKIVHPHFYSGGLHNDVALLILDRPFDLDEHINVVCLPSQGIVVPSGTRCWATGWGKSHFGAKGKYQVILKKVDLPMVDSSTCQSSLRTTRLGRFFRLHQSFVCAGGEPEKDMCKGDGGSPLVCPIPEQDDRYQHVGIVAWGIGCGQNGIPGVYVNVPLFRSWIDKELKKYNIDISEYQN